MGIMYFYWSCLILFGYLEGVIFWICQVFLKWQGLCFFRVESVLTEGF